MIKGINEKIKEALDGRTNRWLSKKCGIQESELSRIMTGRLIPTQLQLDKINIIINTKFRVI